MVNFDHRRIDGPWLIRAMCRFRGPSTFECIDWTTQEDTMTQASFHSSKYAGTGPENYEKHFVPSISAPLADDLIAAAALDRGERVLDVACGTGYVTRKAAELVGTDGVVAGLDVNPGMLSVAREATSDDRPIDWYETSIEATPLPEGSFDVVLCQMGLQFVPDKPKALGEIHRILRPGGRVVLNVPGPTPKLFAELGAALGEHIGPQCVGFVDAVFALHDGDELRRLMTEAGFENVDVHGTRVQLTFPAPEEFMWQYIHSTPLAGIVGKASDEQRAALTEDVRERWQKFVVDGTLTGDVDMTTVRATR
jgi:ubiquinone/menaquinone biosynthesis C-methylase UbiE